MTVVRPANEVPWDDLRTVFGTRGDPAHCWCQRYKSAAIWQGVPEEELASRLYDQTNCGDPDAGSTSGLVAYVDGEPAGWCAVEPRTAYARLLRMPIPWKGRDEDSTDDSVWAITCFAIRAGFRRRGLSRELAAAAVAYAAGRGAKAVEAYPMVTTGKDITWGELHVGSRTTFANLGFREVTHPTLRRFVMRLDL